MDGHGLAGMSDLSSPSATAKRLTEGTDAQIARPPSKNVHSCGLISFCIIFLEPEMGNKIVTEADRKFTPPLPALPGVTLRTHGRGQRVSLERGVATRSKKNPGKRSKKGG